FWKQSNRLVRGEKIWDVLRCKYPEFRCANLFWWYNMYSTVDYSMTPRPLYPADGRKVFDIHTQPMDWRDEVKADLGDFPFPTFWGPGAGIECSRWIAEAARWTEKRAAPDLHLIYLPHLDYGLQKWGPGAPQMDHALGEIDDVAGDLIAFFESQGVRVMVVSEYGISAVSRPIHLNRQFRDQGWIQIKNELGRETLDYGGCEVLAVADHQIAHVYLKSRKLLQEVRRFLEGVDGVEKVELGSEVFGAGIGAERAGDLVVTAAEDAWFTYYYWLDESKAPDFARTVDIHRKPGYDPAELFLDPEIRHPKWEIAKFLLKKKLGLRGLLEVIPLDASLVRGSHGRANVSEGEQAVILGAPGLVESAEGVFAAMCAAVEGGG
ncbi:MAG: alkaline phosphatase family protein, partial [Verrucomicrobiales bacterium]